MTAPFFFKKIYLLKTNTLLISLLLLTSIFWNGCNDTVSGEFSENQPPSTNLTVERINRDSNFRLSSQIQISWFGSDPDGFIAGYEYAINDTTEGNFTFTTKTDSVFILPIEAGQQTDDVLFKVRAIDDKGLADPVGASLVYPVVNSDPEVSINSNQSPPDTLFSVSSFGWNFSDPDGLLNIVRTEVAINDTINGWVEIPFTEDDDGQLFISLEVDNKSSGQKDAQVFLGKSYSTIQLDGEVLSIPVEVGARNTFYVRAVDAAASVSEMDSLSWYIKEQTSSTLFLNDVGGPSSLSKQSKHLELLQAQGISPDIWVINDGQVEQDKVALSEAFPTVIDPTLIKTLAKWDHIYWVSDDIDRNITYAQEILDEFFDQNGTVFVNIPMKSISREDPVFSFLPVDSIAAGQFYLFEDSLAFPTEPSLSDTLKVKSGSFALTNERPIKGVSGSTQLYAAQFRRRRPNSSQAPYFGYKGVAIENAESNLVYFSLDITILDGNNNLDNLINEIVIKRLGFKQ
jgi:hypothetical protein